MSAEYIFDGREKLEDLYRDLDTLANMDFRGSKKVASLLKEYKDQAFLMRELTTVVKDLDINIDFKLAKV